MSKVVFPVAAVAGVAALVGWLGWFSGPAVGETPRAPSGLQSAIQASFAEATCASEAPVHPGRVTLWHPIEVSAHGATLRQKLCGTAAVLRTAFCNDRENCPGADESCFSRSFENAGLLYEAPANETDSSLAEALSEIEQLRRDRAGQTWHGSLFLGVNTDADFAAALRVVAKRQPAQCGAVGGCVYKTTAACPATCATTGNVTRYVTQHAGYPTTGYASQASFPAPCTTAGRVTAQTCANECPACITCNQTPLAAAPAPVRYDFTWRAAPSNRATYAPATCTQVYEAGPACAAPTCTAPSCRACRATCPTANCQAANYPTSCASNRGCQAGAYVVRNFTDAIAVGAARACSTEGCPTDEDENLVALLRHAARQLDARSHDAEDSNDPATADRLHHLADQLRMEARISAGMAPAGPPMGPMMGGPFPGPFFMPAAQIIAPAPYAAPVPCLPQPEAVYYPAQKFSGCIGGACPEAEQVEFEFALPFGGGFIVPTFGDAVPAGATEEIPAPRTPSDSDAIRAAMTEMWKSFWE